MLRESHNLSQAALAKRLGITRSSVNAWRRPSFTEAELPKQASRLYEHVVRSCRIEGIKVETGNFQTYMQVALENDGPVTLLLDSEKLF